MANRRYIDFPIASTSGDTDIILIWQDGANKQTTKATFLSGLPENLDELNDVTISGLTNGQILRYDSVTGKWENTDQGNLDLNDLNDVSIVSPSNGQVLVYNSSTSQWENSSAGYVPYVGAVTTVDLGAQGLRAGYVRFDTTVASVPQEQGLMFWDADDETVDIILNGYTMKIGEDLFYPVKNQTGTTIAKGVAVRFNGTLGASGRLLIAPFIANGSVVSSRFMGVTAEEILNGEDGKVLYFGRVRGINTSAFSEGDILYASTTVAGGYQTAIPVAPNNIVQVAAVISSHASNGTIFVRPTLGSNINKDEGVKIVSVADKNLLQYQSTTSLWENKSLAQVIGSDYVPSTRTITINGTTQDLSANRTFNVGTVTSVGLSSATSGVTIGSTPVTTSGTITLAIATASGSQNGLLSSTDWTTFNGKQNALTNPVTGTGTTNYLPKFTGSTTIGNSQVFDNGTNVGINTNTPLSTNLLGALTIVKSYSSDTPASTTAQTYYTNQSGLYLFGRNSGLTIIGANNEENQIIFANTSTVAFASINTGTGSNSTGGDMYFKVGSNTEAMRIFATTRNVHIGPTPASDNGAKLQVSGTARISGNGLFGGATALTGLNAGISVNGASNSGINFRTSDVLRGYVYTTSGDMWIETVSGSVILAPNGSPALTLASTGAATFSSSVTATSFITSSDLRLKEVIEKDGDLAVYKRKGEEQIHYGYIAQEMQESYPNQVHEAQDGYLSLNYVEILVKKVNELEKKIKQLEK